jgi:lyso-ornithine lipid O-acyltransferase
MSRLAPWLRGARRVAAISATVSRELARGSSDHASLSRVFADLARQHGMSIEVDGEPPRRPCVLVANHVSYLDPIALLALVPARPVAKGEVGRWPLIGQVARSRGVLLVDRACPWSGARVLRNALAALAVGDSVLNFPEGTTTRGDQVLPFRRGIFGIARLARVPIVPVALTYPDPASAWVGDETFVPHYLRTAARERIEVRVAFGAPLMPGSRPAAELAEVARGRILSQLDSTTASSSSAMRNLRSASERISPAASAAVRRAPPNNVPGTAAL